MSDVSYSYTDKNGNVISGLPKQRIGKLDLHIINGKYSERESASNPAVAEFTLDLPATISPLILTADVQQADPTQARQQSLLAYTLTLQVPSSVRSLRLHKSFCADKRLLLNQRNGAARPENYSLEEACFDLKNADDSAQLNFDDRGIWNLPASAHLKLSHMTHVAGLVMLLFGLHEKDKAAPLQQDISFFNCNVCLKDEFIDPHGLQMEAARRYRHVTFHQCYFKMRSLRDHISIGLPWRCTASNCACSMEDNFNEGHENLLVRPYFRRRSFSSGRKQDFIIIAVRQ